MLDSAFNLMPFHFEHKFILCRDSFFSCTHGKSGYSGTATFCRSSVTVPCAAEEGVTGETLLRVKDPGSTDLIAVIKWRGSQVRLCSG